MCFKLESSPKQASERLSSAASLQNSSLPALTACLSSLSAPSPQPTGPTGPTRYSVPAQWPGNLFKAVNSATIELTLCYRHLSGITILHCLIFNVLIRFVSYVFACFVYLYIFAISGWRVNLVPFLHLGQKQKSIISFWKVFIFTRHPQSKKNK